MKKIVLESSVLTLEAGLGAAHAIIHSTAGAHKVCISASVLCAYFASGVYAVREYLIVPSPLLQSSRCVTQVSGSGKEIVPLIITKAFNNTKTRVTDYARDIVVKYMEV